jgi:hypothetical protein
VIAAGSILAAAGLVPLLASDGLTARRAGFAAWAAGMLVLAAALVSNVIAHVRVSGTAHPGVAVAVLVVALGALVAGTALLRRRPSLLLLAVVAVAPVRVPFALGGEEAKLLVPLYAVLAIAVAESAWGLVRGDDAPSRLGRIGWAAAAFVGWSALSLLWSADTHAGGVAMLFYLLPFAFLVSRIGRLRAGATLLAGAFAIELALALLFAGVALVQEATRHIFWNPTIEVGNAYRSYFRVNSLFWDASIYGRFMVVAMVLAAGALVLLRVAPVPLAAFLAVALAGLWFSYSQSSYIALAAGVLVLAAATWPPRAVAALAAGGLLAGLLAFALVTQSHSTTRVSSGRVGLIERGGTVIREHPLLGAGSGGFARAAVKGPLSPGRIRRAESHTTPVTVLAELGPLGLAAYAWLLVEVARAALARTRPRGPAIVVLAAFAALVASSIFYDAFFEDPATWISMAVIARMEPWRAQTPRPGAMSARERAPGARQTAD